MRSSGRSRPPFPKAASVPNRSEYSMFLHRDEQHLRDRLTFPGCADVANASVPFDRQAYAAHRLEDTPFRPCLFLQDATGMSAQLALRPHPDRRVNEARSAMLAALAALEQTDGAKWLFYSRDNNHYVAARRYAPQYYRRWVLIEAIESLEAVGLVEHQRTKPSPTACYRSRVRATERLRAQIRVLTAAAIVFRPSELIVLRDAAGRPLAYRETAATRALRSDVMAQNAFLDGISVTLEHPEAAYDAQGYLVIGGCRINPGRKTSHRIFNENFRRGGRWYGPWWQTVPSRVRTGIYLNGEPTCELDIRACHMRLLCAAAGIELGDADPYNGLGLPRQEVKLAINVMLNAPSWRSARAALLEQLCGRHGASAGTYFDSIRATIERCFPALNGYWNSGFGVVLQNIDSEICARVQRRLREERVPCLSVHDSFIVPQSMREFAETTITSVFDFTCHSLARRGSLSR